MDISGLLTAGPSLKAFVCSDDSAIRAQRHIKPMHQYVATRLVIEGGFLPDEVTPHPPLTVTRKRGRYSLSFDETVATGSEQTVLGGLKTKNVDVVVSKPGVGPVLCVSLKGTCGAFRNLTNRMEEAIGDCTNIHMMYPGLVYGFLHLVRVNREGDPNTAGNDITVDGGGHVVDSVTRYYEILQGLAGRETVRDEISKYEAIGFLLVEGHGASAGEQYAGFPPSEDRADLDAFFRRLYDVYIRRYTYVAPAMASVRRVEWDEDSPAFRQAEDELQAGICDMLDYAPRLA